MFASMLARIGWCLLALVGILALFFGLAVLALRLTSDPIWATIGVDLVFVAIGVSFRLWWRRSGRAAVIRRRKLDELTWLCVSGAVVVVFIAGQVMAFTALDVFGSPSFEALNDQRAQTPVWLLLTLTFVVAPMGEELLLRGTVQELLRDRVPVAARIVTVTVAFALMHGNIVQGLAVVPIGVALSMLYEHTRSPWPGVVVHSAYNFLAVLIPSGLIAGLAHPVPAIGLSLVATVVLITLWIRLQRNSHRLQSSIDVG